MSSSVLSNSAFDDRKQHEDTTSAERSDLASVQSSGEVTHPTPDPRLQEGSAFSTSHSLLATISSNVGPPAFQYNAFLHPVDTSPSQSYPTITTHRASPLSAELRVQTDLWRPEKITEREPGGIVQENEPDTHKKQLSSNSKLPVRTSSVKSALAAAHFTGGSLSPASAVSSPGLGPLADITPLPSPIAPSGSPGAWKTMASSAAESITSDHQLDSSSASRASPKKRKAYQGLTSPATGTTERDQILAANAANHSRNRTVSEYAPSPPPPRTRCNAVSGTQTPTNTDSHEVQSMQREEYLAVQRGISLQSPRPPTPPASNRSTTGSSDLESPPSSPRPNRGAIPLLYEAKDVRSGVSKRWSAIRQLGKGTFSTVMLATSEEKSDARHKPTTEEQLNPKSLVAIKICEHGPAGGADEKKIETSLKRELDILRSIDHPSLVHLKAVSVLDKRAFLVLNYAAGGDLFELASLHLDLLVPSMIRRIFAELVAATRYLHLQYIVHRDIKLENVLFNIPTAKISTLPSDWQRYPTPVITLTDLGLGRWIPRPPESPLLNTRCGSEDYAAPELLMGQEYDGRATDAWALGVLLYAIMEGRLPFDPIPGSRRQSPTSHRIARCEWSWVRWADKDGEWDPEKAPELEGGRECVEGLLKRARSRWALDVVEAKDWVQGGIAIEGELTRDPDGDDAG